MNELKDKLISSFNRLKKKLYEINELTTGTYLLNDKLIMYFESDLRTKMTKYEIASYRITAMMLVNYSSNVIMDNLQKEGLL